MVNLRLRAARSPSSAFPLQVTRPASICRCGSIRPAASWMKVNAKLNTVGRRALCTPPPSLCQRSDRKAARISAVNSSLLDQLDRLGCGMSRGRRRSAEPGGSVALALKVPRIGRARCTGTRASSSTAGTLISSSLPRFVPVADVRRARRGIVRRRAGRVRRSAAPGPSPWRPGRRCPAAPGSWKRRSPSC
jgi:hypothetical protein